MIEELGEVVRVEGPYAWVNATRQSSCSTCSVQKGCGSGVLAGLFGSRFHQVKAINRINARLGERVVLGIDDGLLVRGSLLVYMLPLILLLCGGLLGQYLAPQLAMAGSELPSILGAMCGMGLGFAWLMGRTRRWERAGTFQAEILRLAQPTSTVAPVRFVHH